MKCVQKTRAVYFCLNHPFLHTKSESYALAFALWQAGGEAILAHAASKGRTEARVLTHCNTGSLATARCRDPTRTPSFPLSMLTLREGDDLLERSSLLNHCAGTAQRLG